MTVHILFVLLINIGLIGGDLCAISHGISARYDSGRNNVQILLVGGLIVLYFSKLTRYRR